MGDNVSVLALDDLTLFCWWWFGGSVRLIGFITVSERVFAFGISKIALICLSPLGWFATRDPFFLWQDEKVPLIFLNLMKLFNRDRLSLVCFRFIIIPHLLYSTFIKLLWNNLQIFISLRPLLVNLSYFIRFTENALNRFICIIKRTLVLAIHHVVS